MANHKIKNQCTGHNRKGESCKKSAMKGKTKCRNHGGKNTGAPKNNANSLKHGFYSSALNESEREDYERVRANPITIDDHLALLEVKIKRYLNITNTDFNFDQFETNMRTEVESVPASGMISQKTWRSLKKPMGPPLLISMLAEWRKLFFTKFQIQREQGDGKDVVKTLRYGGTVIIKDDNNDSELI